MEVPPLILLYILLLTIWVPLAILADVVRKSKYSTI